MILPRGRFVRGALFSFLGFTIFVGSDVFTKSAGLEGASVFAIMLFSSWSALAVAFLGAALTGRIGKLKPQQKKPHAIRAGLFLLNSIVNVIAFTNLPITTVYIGIFASPFLISLCGAAFMKERLSRRQLFAILAGFLGVLIALLPAKTAQPIGIENPVAGYISLPFFTALFVANMLYLRIMGRTETPESTTFVPFLFRGLVLLPFLLVGDAMGSLSPQALLFILAQGICTGIGFLLVSSAYKLAPVAIVSSFHYTQLVTGAVLGYLVFGTAPSLWTWAGGAVIIAAGLVVAHEAHRLEKTAAALALQEKDPQSFP